MYIKIILISTMILLLFTCCFQQANINQLERDVYNLRTDFLNHQVRYAEGVILTNETIQTLIEGVLLNRRGILND